MLTKADERLRRDGVTLWLAALNPDVRHVIEHAPLGEVLGRERILCNVESAMERYQQWESAPRGILPESGTGLGDGV